MFTSYFAVCYNLLYNETVYQLGNDLYINYEIVINAELHRIQQCKEEVLTCIALFKLYPQQLGDHFVFDRKIHRQLFALSYQFRV